MLLKNLHIHSLHLLNFVYILLFDVEAAPENAKLAVLERQQFEFSLHSSQP